MIQKHNGGDLREKITNYDLREKITIEFLKTRRIVNSTQILWPYAKLLQYAKRGYTQKCGYTQKLGHTQSVAIRGPNKFVCNNGNPQ